MPRRLIHSQHADVLVDATVADRLPEPSPWNVLLLWDGERSPLLGDRVTLPGAPPTETRVIAVEDDVAIEFAGASATTKRTLVVVSLRTFDEQAAA